MLCVRTRGVSGVGRKVCRKIADKLRQPPSEQAEHVLIAVYPRPVNVSCGDDLGEESGVHSDDEVVGREPPADDRVMTTESFHGGGLERVEIRRRCVLIDVNHLPTEANSKASTRAYLVEKIKNEIPFLCVT